MRLTMAVMAAFVPLLGWVTAAPCDAAGSAASMPTIYACDGHCGTAVLKDASPDRGPPAANGQVSIDDPVHRWSSSAPVRSERSENPTVNTYDDPAPSAQTDCPTTTTDGHAVGTAGDVSWLASAATIAVPEVAGLADDVVIVRGGTSDVPPADQVFSGSFGHTIEEDAHVPHGQIRATTAGEIRAGGGRVEVAPEMTRGGNLNDHHVNIGA